MISRLFAILILLFPPFTSLKSQIKTVEFELEEKSRVLETVDMGSQGFFILTGHYLSKSKSANYYLYKYNSDLELVYKAPIPYERQTFVGYLEPTIYVSPNTEYAYVVWLDKKDHIIHQVNSKGETRNMILPKAKFRDTPYTFFCSNSHLAGIVYKDKAKSYFLGLIEHASFRAKPAVPIKLPKIQKLKNYDDSQTNWEFINYDHDRIIFSRRINKLNDEAQYVDENNEEMLHKILVAEVDFNGHLLKEFTIMRGLKNKFRPVVSRTLSKSPNSSRIIGSFALGIPSNQHNVFTAVGAIDGEFRERNSGRFNYYQPNQNAFGTLVYNPRTGHYLYYGIHNADLDDDFETIAFHGFFISEYDQNGELIRHAQHVAPSTEQFEDTHLAFSGNGGFYRQMKLEIDEDGSYRFKIWTRNDVYIAEVNAELELIEYTILVFDEQDDFSDGKMGEVALYPKNHPISKYMGSLEKDFYLDLMDISYIHSFQSSPGKEILLHLTDVDNPENISLLLFSEN